MQRFKFTGGVPAKSKLASLLLPAVVVALSAAAILAQPASSAPTIEVDTTPCSSAGVESGSAKKSVCRIDIAGLNRNRFEVTVLSTTPAGQESAFSIKANGRIDYNGAALTASDAGQVALLIKVSDSKGKAHESQVSVNVSVTAKQRPPLRAAGAPYTLWAVTSGVANNNVGTVYGAGINAKQIHYAIISATDSGGGSLPAGTFKIKLTAGLVRYNGHEIEGDSVSLSIRVYDKRGGATGDGAGAKAMPIVVSSTVSVSHPEPAPVVAQPQVQEVPVQEAEAQTRGTPDPIPPSKDHPDLECKLHTHEWTYPEMKQPFTYMGETITSTGFEGTTYKMSHVHSDKDYVGDFDSECPWEFERLDGPWAREHEPHKYDFWADPQIHNFGDLLTGRARWIFNWKRKINVEQESIRADQEIDKGWWQIVCTPHYHVEFHTGNKLYHESCEAGHYTNGGATQHPAADAKGRSNGRYAGKAYGTGSKHMHPNHTEAVTPDLYYCPTLGSSPRSRGSQWGQAVIASNPSGICKTESELSTTNWITTRSRYNFDVHDPGSTSGWQRGVFIFAGRVDGKWKAYYIGHTKDRLSSITTSHEKWSDARAAGATHIHTLPAQTLGHGESVACEMIRAFAPPLNEQCK